MKTATAATLVAAALACGAHSAAANEVGFYIGGWVGQASKEADRGEFEAFAEDVYAFYEYTPAAISASFDDSESAFSLLVGYRLTRFLALEGAYARLGHVAYNASTSGAFPRDAGAITLTTESETSGFAFSLLGTLPLSYRWEAYARIGALIASNTFRTSIKARGEVFAPAPGSINESFSKGSDELYAGAGVALRFLDTYDLRLEYQRIFDSGLEITGGAGDIGVASLGLTATF